MSPFEPSWASHANGTRNEKKRKRGEAKSRDETVRVRWKLNSARWKGPCRWTAPCSAATTTTTTIGDDARSIFTEARSLTERNWRERKRERERELSIDGTKTDKLSEKERKEKGKGKEKEKKRGRGDYWNLSFLFRNLSREKESERERERERGPRCRPRRRNSIEPREPLAKHTCLDGTGGFVVAAKFKIRARREPRPRIRCNLRGYIRVIERSVPHVTAQVLRHVSISWSFLLSCTFWANLARRW